MSEMEVLRYPVGRYESLVVVSAAERAVWIQELRQLPAQVRAAAAAANLEQAYRPGGWTARQVVHHVADSHMNSFIRFKLALTEEVPMIKPYDEARWADLADMALPVEVSLALIDGIHTRWLAVLEAMSEADFSRKFRHPEIGEIDLNYALGLYAWHGRHHLGHLKLAAAVK
jgi:hypothetical protein